MAKACGLRIGPRRFELFVLDGSPKNPKIVTSLAGAIPPDEEDPIGAASHALKRAFKAHKIPRENLSVVLDARAAAFRRVNLPVSDPAKIESVIKFEVEAQLPQFSIDDVIVDFYIQQSTSESSSLLVTAVPKDEVSNAIRICEGAGIEPLEVEVETTALVNAAFSAGLCGVDSAQVLVHIGEESTAVAVVDGGKVREMRVIQIGALSQTPHGTPPAAGEEEAKPDDDEYFTEAPPIEGVAEIVQRLRRELSRTVSGARTANELDGIYLCGFDLPCLVGSEILGVAVQPFGAFEIAIQDGGVHAEYRSGAIAFGAALGQLGGGIIKSGFRKEELKFTGAFERVELPLAVLCLLIATFLGVWYLFLDFERQRVDHKLAYMLNSSVNYMMGDLKSGLGGNLNINPKPEKLKKYVDATTGVVPGSNPPQNRVDPIRNRYAQLEYIKSMLSVDISKLKKELGHESDLTQPQSALKGLTLVLDLLAQGGDKYGRISLRSLDSNYITRAGKQDTIKVDLSLCFFADSGAEATNNYEAFYADLREQPWFVDFRRPSSEPFTGAESGVFLPNFSVTVNTAAATEVKS